MPDGGNHAAASDRPGLAGPERREQDGGGANRSGGARLPQFTSCCPAWVKYAEQFCPELLANLSTCRSPQQMFGSLAKATLPETLGIDRKDLFVVSIMPCTAKKFEAQRPEFEVGGQPDVDAVLTTQEFGKMIKQAGIQFNQLTPESLDLPLGFKTGAGVIFGTTGGVSEAVLRYAYEKLTGVKLDSADFTEVRGSQGVRIRKLKLGEVELKLAIVHGLKNARAIAGRIARFLGDSTAQGEKLLDNLVKLAQDEPAVSDEQRQSWLKNTYTST